MNTGIPLLCVQKEVFGK